MKYKLVFVSLIIAIRHGRRGGWPTFGWGSVAGGRFFAGDVVSLAPCADAEPVVGAAGPVVLKLGLESLAGGWAWVKVL